MDIEDGSVIMNGDFILPGENIEIKIKEFNITNPSPIRYYEPIIDVSLSGYVPVSAGFGTEAISTNCYQCRFISSTQVKMGFCVADGTKGDLQTGTVGKLNVIYIKK